MLFNNVVLRCINILIDTPIFMDFITTFTTFITTFITTFSRATNMILRNTVIHFKLNNFLLFNSTKYTDYCLYLLFVVHTRTYNLFNNMAYRVILRGFVWKSVSQLKSSTLMGYKNEETIKER